jgi:hypothetical protein
MTIVGHAGLEMSDHRYFGSGVFDFAGDLPAAHVGAVMLSGPDTAGSS